MAAPDYGGAEHHLVKITLKGRDNETFTGAFLLRNLTALLGGARAVLPDRDTNATAEDPLVGSPGHPEDPSGASYYVIAVVLVYGMSIVMLIASHIKRKHAKLVEDKQIHKYLQEFQVVKERSSRDSYKSLKSSIMAKLNMHHRTSTYRTLSHAILPMMAVGLPTLDEDVPEADKVRTTRRASFQVGAFRPVNPIRSGRRASELDITTFKHMRNPPSSRSFARVGSKEQISLVRYGSLRGGYHGAADHKLPSSIEEEMPAAVAGDAVPVIHVTPGDTDRRDSHTDVSNLSQGHKATAPTATDHEKRRYKSISLSKDCRVYEIPKNVTPNTSLRPGGVHIPLFNTSVSKPDRCLSSSALSDTSNERDWQSTGLNHNHSKVDEGTRVSKYDAPLIDSCDTALYIKNTRAGSGAANTSHFPNGGIDKSMQYRNVQSHTVNIQQPPPISPCPRSRDQLDDQQGRNQLRGTAHLSEYPWASGQGPGTRRLSDNVSPIHDQLDVISPPPREVRAHSISTCTRPALDHVQPIQRSTEDLAPASTPCGSPWGSSSPSENSDSDDVWMVGGQDHRDSDASDCPSLPGLALHGAGTSPLLAANNLNRMDSSDSTGGPGQKTFDSISESSAPSKEWNADSLLQKIHQVTSV